MNQLSGSVPTLPGKLHFFYLNSKCPPFCISLLFSLINSLSIRSKSWQLTLELLRCARFVSPVNVLVGNRNRKVFRSFSNKRFFFKKLSFQISQHDIIRSWYLQEEFSHSKDNDIIMILLRYNIHL